MGWEVFYQSLKHRYNWGGLAGHLSYRSVSTYSRVDTVEVNGDRVQAREYNLVTTRQFPGMPGRSVDGPLRPEFDDLLQQNLVGSGAVVIHHGLLAVLFYRMAIADVTETAFEE